MKQDIAILDLGTSRMTVLIGSRGINNSISIDGIGICEYAGYIDGAWLAPEKLGSVIAQVIATAESSARRKIEKLYVGVPGDFSVVKVNNVVMSLGKKRRIYDADVDALHSQGNEYFSDPDVTVINIQPIYYTLDDDRKLIAPVGLVSTKLGGCLSYTLASKDFINTIGAAVRTAGVPETEYVSSQLAEMLFLFDDYKRDNSGAMLADVGALSTTLSIGRGDGIARQYFFAWGGERITVALAEKFGLAPEVASQLKRKINLSLDPSFEPPDDDGLIQTTYAIEVDNEPLQPFDVEEVNSVVKDELARFARYIDKALKVCDYPYPEFLPLSITGGGVNIRGAEEFISSCIGRDVEMVKPYLPLFDNPQMSSALGLMDMVLTAEDEYTGIFGRLRRWLARRHK